MKCVENVHACSGHSETTHLLRFVWMSIRWHRSTRRGFSTYWQMTVMFCSFNQLTIWVDFQIAQINLALQASRVPQTTNKNTTGSQTQKNKNASVKEWISRTVETERNFFKWVWSEFCLKLIKLIFQKSFLVLQQCHQIAVCTNKTLECYWLLLGCKNGKTSSS